MPERPPGDRRKKQRIPRRLPVRFGTEAKMIGGTALDVADGGLRVESAESFPQGSVVDVFVQFPRHAVRLRARIVWSGGGQNAASLPVVGLAFTQPEPGLVKAYSEWVAEMKLATREIGPSGESRLAGSVPGAHGASPGGAGSGAAKAGNAAKPGDAAGSTKGRPDSAAPTTPAPKPAAPREPSGTVRKKVETRLGNAYAILLERRGTFWRLTIAGHPRQPGVDAADFEETFTDHASAEAALQSFLKAH
ncbi:MAG TPA: PilZ domain-containing protein [Candidatus Polarisedimenticolia bacterium]